MTDTYVVALFYRHVDGNVEKERLHQTKIKARSYDEALGAARHKTQIDELEFAGWPLVYHTVMKIKEGV